MSELHVITGGKLDCNSYVVCGSGGDCIVVDCCDYAALHRFLTADKLNCRALLLTHAHFDHSAEAALLQRDGAKVYLHKDEVRLFHSAGNLGMTCGVRVIHCEPDIKVSDGDSFDICGYSVKVIHTPGHTAGGVCYLVGDKYLFTGDTLFNQSVGRTDFPTGNGADLRRSVREKLFTLEKDYEIYPGHGISTTLFFEKENNVYV